MDDCHGGPVLNIDAVIKNCIEDPASLEALIERLKKTLKPWETYGSAGLVRKNLLGEVIGYCPYWELTSLYDKDLSLKGDYTLI